VHFLLFFANAVITKTIKAKVIEGIGRVGKGIWYRMSFPKLVENPHIMVHNPCWFIAVFIAALGFHFG